jgi:type IV secretory pathway VirB6-like protein
MLGVVYLPLMLAYTHNNAYANSNPPNPLCVMADDFGDLNKKSVTVNSWGQGDKDDTVFHQDAPSGWLDTGIDVTSGKALQIRSSGQVNLCNSAEPSVVTFTVSPKNSGWQVSQIPINKGWNYKITVSGSYSRWATSACGSSKYWSSDCYSKNGRGLFVYVGNDPSQVTNWEDLDPTPVKIGSAGYAKNPYFYELYNYTTNTSGYDFDLGDVENLTQEIYNKTPEGRLHFRYADGNTGGGYDTDWSGNYADNRGGYKITITYTKDCTGTNGQYLVGYIAENTSGDSVPNIPEVPNLTDAGKVINLNDYAKADKVTQRASGLYNENSPGTGRLWLKVIDTSTFNYWGDGLSRGDDKYDPDISNTGEYKVDITTVAPVKTGFTTMLNSIIDPLRDFVRGDGNTMGLTERMYKGITSRYDFVSLIRAFMAMSIIFFAFKYMVGLSNITQKELFALIVKLSIVITLLGETSWEFFRTYLFSFFIEGTDDLIRLMTSQFSVILEGSTVTGQNVGNIPGQETALAASTGNHTYDTFAFLNETLQRFFTKETNIKILGLMTSFPLGVIIGLLIYVGMGFFIYTVFRAILIYIIAIVVVAILLFLAPIFIPMLMFEKTKPMFEKWIKQLMSFSLQPVLLFTVLAIFNVFIFSALYQLLSFSVCWQCIASVDLPLSEWLGGGKNGTLGNFDKFCTMWGYAPWGVDSNQAIGVKLAKNPVGLFMVLIFFILCNAMMAFCDWISEVSNTFTAGANAVGANRAANQAVAGATETAKTSARLATSAGKTVAQKGAWMAGRIDAASGHKVSDGMKRAARKALNSNKMLGGSARRGEEDGMGGVDKAYSFLKTSDEKLATKRQSEFLNSLNDKDRKAFVDMRQAERLAAQKQGPEAMKAYNEIEKKRDEILGEQTRLKGTSINRAGANRADLFLAQELEIAKKGFGDRSLDRAADLARKGDAIQQHQDLLAATSKQSLDDSISAYNERKNAPDEYISTNIRDPKTGRITKVETRRKNPFDTNE